MSLPRQACTSVKLNAGVGFESLEHVSKETYVCQKRPMCVKRDLGFESLEKREQEHVSKETYVCQKRPMCVKTHIGARRVSLCVGVY
jgi:hypothetical protein